METERAAGFADLLLDPQKGKKRALDSDRLESWRESGGGERVLLPHPAGRFPVKMYSMG